MLVLLGLVAAADVYALAAEIRMRGLLPDAEDTGPAAWDPTTAAYLLCGLAFLVWFRRARRNAEILAPGLQRRTPGWAVGAWFVPVANLWFPRQIAGDIWRASKPADVREAPRPTPRTLLNCWWALWVATMTLGEVSDRLYLRAQDADSLRTSLDLVITTDAIDLAAAAAAALVVHRLTTMQTARTRPHVPGPPPSYDAVPEAV